MSSAADDLLLIAKNMAEAQEITREVVDVLREKQLEGEGVVNQ